MNVIVFLADGFELVEAMCPIDMLRRAGAEVVTVSISDTEKVTSAQGVAVMADASLASLDGPLPDMVFLPGGMPGASHLRENAKVCDMTAAVFSRGGYVAAICAAPFILGELGLLRGKTATCYPGFEESLIGATLSDRKVVRDGNVITAAGMGAALPFAAELVAALYGRDKASTLLETIQTP
ncbi:MAG: DJ-1/PfpI family protein [Clostridia bacterium]|nr:DJ-1/PfpI family protein [Clostridia bacterium]